jgi:nucleoside-diphosphate-sugar epimerase
MEWVYAKDAAQGTVLALKAKDLKSRIFNITMGEVTSPDAFAAALKTVVPGARVRIDLPPGTGASLMNMDHGSDLSLARDVLGYQPRYGIEASVRDMVEWFRANQRAGRG